MDVIQGTQENVTQCKSHNLRILSQQNLFQGHIRIPRFCCYQLLIVTNLPILYVRFNIVKLRASVLGPFRAVVTFVPQTFMISGPSTDNADVFLPT